MDDLIEKFQPYVPADTLDKLAWDISEWNVKQFGPLAPLDGKAAHLAKEVNEVLERPNIPDEWVDVFFFFACAYVHFGPKMMREAIRAKLEKNQRRVWPSAPDENGVFEHAHGTED